jgi:hypothetical protein
MNKIPFATPLSPNLSPFSSTAVDSNAPVTPGAWVPASSGPPADPLDWFSNMIPHCMDYAQAARASGQPIIGIMCEYALRELILAAGAVPVCLCGGDADTIPAAEAHLPVNLCPLVKSTYGYLVAKANPFLEIADLVIAETTCDAKKKMFELMGEKRSTYLIELPHKKDNLISLPLFTRLDQTISRNSLPCRFPTYFSSCREQTATDRVTGLLQGAAKGRRKKRRKSSDFRVMPGKVAIFFPSGLRMA